MYIFSGKKANVYIYTFNLYIYISSFFSKYNV